MSPVFFAIGAALLVALVIRGAQLVRLLLTIDAERTARHDKP